MSSILHAKPLMNKILFFVAVLAAASAIVAISPARTSALSGSDFDPGRIIDDSVFYNNARMSVSQIQEFLDSKVPDCDTNGEQSIYGTTRAAYGASQGYPAPYICINEYSQTISGVTNGSTDLCTGDVSAGTKSAAQIIYDVAQACRINPQVLIVMLQKEQSLITDTWPWPSQYDKAMGYACPDTGPNNSANCDAAFFGFFNQVYNAAQAFRRYEANPNSYNYRPQANNFVLYNPNTACGGSTIYIDNQATANLYIYTPYQPNQAALDNLYGTGDSCSAYGNRNFWRLFNDWFGPTEGTPLFKVSGDNKTYIEGANDTYYHVQSAEIREAYGYGKRYFTIEAVEPSYISDRTYAGVLTYAADFEDSSTYVVNRGGKYEFTLGTLFTDNYGYTSPDVSHLPATLIYYLPDAGSMRSIVSSYETSDKYLIDSGAARKFLDDDAYNSGTPAYSSLSYVRLTDDYIDSLPDGAAVLSDNRIIRTSDKGSYKYYDGSLIYNIPRSLIENSGLSEDSTLHSSTIADIARAPDTATEFVVGDNNNYYLLDGGFRYHIPASELTLYGFSASDFVYMPDSFIARIKSTGNLGRFIQIEGSSAKYYLVGGELRYINSSDAVSELGLSYDKLELLTTQSLQYIPRSNTIQYKTGTLFKEVGSSRTYLINSSATRLYINSAALLDDFGRTTTRVVAPTAVSGFVETGRLASLSRDSGGNVWLIHSDGFAQSIPASQLGSDRLNVTAADLEPLSSGVINSKDIIEPLKDLVRDSTNNRVYYVENGLKRHIQSPAAITGLGLTYDDISIVSNVFLSSIPDGAIIK